MQFNSITPHDTVSHNWLDYPTVRSCKNLGFFGGEVLGFWFFKVFKVLKKFFSGFYILVYIVQMRPKFPTQEEDPIHRISILFLTRPKSHMDRFL